MAKATSGNREPDNEKSELTIDELNAVGGGAVHIQSKPDSTKQPSDSDSDRRKAGLDNIQKMLDIIHGMNPLT
jgi:hypothetical protein